MHPSATRRRFGRPGGSRIRRALLPLAAAAVAVGSTLVAPAMGATAAAATSWTAGACTSGNTTGVTVVVDFQDLNKPLTAPVVRCVKGLTTSSTGLAALQAAQLKPVGTKQYGLAFVCRLLTRPTATETLTVAGKPYQETCQRTPAAKAYWSYWSATNGGSWTYSTSGASTQKVKLGGFQGWSFSLNKTVTTNPKPRLTPKRPSTGK